MADELMRLSTHRHARVSHAGFGYIGHGLSALGEYFKRIEGKIDRDTIQCQRNQVRREASNRVYLVQQMHAISLAYRNVLSRTVGAGAAERCEVAFTTVPIVTGWALYAIDDRQLRNNHPILREHIQEYVDDDGWLGCVLSPAGSEAAVNLLMGQQHLHTARAIFSKLWKGRNCIPSPSIILVALRTAS